MVKLTVVVATFALLAGTPLSAIGAQDASPTAGETSEVGEAIVVEVEIGEFFVKPLEMDLVAGTPYLFEVTNTGTEIHEFVIEPADAVDEPLEIETLTLLPCRCEERSDEAIHVTGRHAHVMDAR